MIKRGFRNVTEQLSRCFGLENPLLSEVDIRFFEKHNLSSVTNKKNSAVSKPGMLGNFSVVQKLAELEIKLQMMMSYGYWIPVTDSMIEGQWVDFYTSDPTL